MEEIKVTEIEFDEKLYEINIEENEFSESDEKDGKGLVGEQDGDN